MGAAVSRFISRFNEFQSLPSGASFSVRVTDFEAEEATKEYLEENREQVNGLIRQAAGVSLEVSDPSIRFHPDEIVLSAKGGRGLLKVRASLSADVRWNDGLSVNVRSLELPFVSVTPQKLNSVVEGPLKGVMARVAGYAEIRSFRITEGAAVLDAVRK